MKNPFAPVLYRGACSCGWESEKRRYFRFEAFEDAEKHKDETHPRWYVRAKEETP